MSECMCDTVLHECHTENWVWLVLQAKVSCSLFSNQPIGGGLHFYRPGCCSGLLWTLMQTKIKVLLQSQVAALMLVTH